MKGCENVDSCWFRWEFFFFRQPKIAFYFNFTDNFTLHSSSVFALRYFYLVFPAVACYIFLISLVISTDAVLFIFAARPVTLLFHARPREMLSMSGGFCQFCSF